MSAADRPKRMMATTAGSEVAILLEDSLASSVCRLSQRGPVWAIKTAAMEKARSEVLDEGGSRHDIALFNTVGDPETDLLNVIDVVDERHGLASVPRERPATVLRVQRASPTGAVRRVVSQLGFSDIEPTTDGFIARWSC